MTKNIIIAILSVLVIVLLVMFFVTKWNGSQTNSSSQAANTYTCVLDNIYKLSPQSTSNFALITLAALNESTSTLPYLNGQKTGVQVSGTIVDILSGSATGFFIIKDNAGNFAEINNDFRNETMLQVGDRIITDGFFLYRNTALPLPSSTPIIYSSGVCDSYQ